MKYKKNDRGLVVNTRNGNIVLVPNGYVLDENTGEFVKEIPVRERLRLYIEGRERAKSDNLILETNLEA